MAREKILVLVDGKSVFYRGFYAMPNLTTRNGAPTGGVYGFAVLALELFSRIKPDYVAVAWDKAHTNIAQRLKIYDKYKGNRHPAPPEFYAQIPLLRELLDALNWPFYEVDNYEADDIIGTFDAQANAQNIRTIMISSDLDLLQLVDENTELYALKKGLANLEKFDVAHFREKYGIEIAQFADLKALKGDASDNIPGVPGVGEKTALDLLKKFATLAGVYANIDSPEIRDSVRKKLIAGQKSAEMSRALVQIFRDAPLELDFAAADVHNLQPEKLRAKFQEFEFTSLLRKLPEFMRADGNSAKKIAPNSAEIPAKNDDKIAQNIEPEKLEIAEIPAAKFDDSAREKLVKSEKIFVAIADPNEKNLARGQRNLLDMVAPKSEKYLLVADDESAFYQMSFAEFAAEFAGASVVIHDAKSFAEELLARGLKSDFLVEFDTRIASFLLNSLRKSPTLETAVNFAENDENGEPRTMRDGEKIGATIALFREKSAELKRDVKLEKLARELDFPFQILLAKIEQRGAKIDPEILRKMSGELAQNADEIEREIWRMVGREFNVNSPSQLAVALFRDLKLPTAGIKKSARGGFSTGQKELDKLRGQHPIIEKIEEIREILKLKNTYVDTLPALADAGNRIHTTLRQDVTATGRLSSANPNLQNIPTRSERGHEVRRAFVADGGKILISADYSQFELRLAAALAHDENMIAVFSHDSADIHRETAARAFNKSPADVTPEERRHAKVINFGVLYGMSPHGLAAATGMNYGDARAFIDRYFEIRQPIRAFLDETMRRARDDGFVETLFGRRRPTPDVRSGNFAIRAAAKRAAANMPIQGTEADLMKMAMLAVENALPGLQFMQIHDSIMVECEPENAAEIAQKMQQIMENIYPPLGVKLRVDVKMGETWAEL